MNAAHGFINMLARLLVDRRPSHLACALDIDWRPAWRVELIPSYKTHRLDLPATPELDEQMPVLYGLLRKCGLAVAGVPGYEAEDVIGALVPRCAGKVEIVSGDRDLFQLVSDGRVVVLYPKRGVSDLTTVDEEYIRSKYGIPGRAYGDFALLRGDTSDGLPGVSGIGEKTATALIAKHGSVERVIEAALTGESSSALAKVRASLDYLDRAARVVLISSDVPVGDIDMSISDPAPDVVEQAAEHGLGNAVGRLTSAIRSVRKAGSC